MRFGIKGYFDRCTRRRPKPVRHEPRKVSFCEESDRR